jgi:hypothetical protein
MALGASITQSNKENSGITFRNAKQPLDTFNHINVIKFFKQRIILFIINIKLKNISS